MAGRNRDLSKLFRRMAERRIKWAVLLGSPALHTLGDLPEGLTTNGVVENAAMGVECALKSLYLKSTPGGRRIGSEEDFHGSKAHNFDWLQGQLANRGVSFPRPIVMALSRMHWRTHDDRYDLRIVSREQATDYLKSATLVIEWALARL